MYSKCENQSCGIVTDDGSLKNGQYYCQDCLDDFESIVTCSACGKNFSEEAVNITDYELDLCTECEKQHLIKL